MNRLWADCLICQNCALWATLVPRYWCQQCSKFFFQCTSIKAQINVQNIARHWARWLFWCSEKFRKAKSRPCKLTKKPINNLQFSRLQLWQRNCDKFTSFTRLRSMAQLLQPFQKKLLKAYKSIGPRSKPVSENLSFCKLECCILEWIWSISDLWILFCFHLFNHK
jgi:hypothetical protein